MRRMMKLSLTVLFILTIFLAWTEKIHILKVEAAEEIIDNDLVSEEVIFKVEVHISEYLNKFPVDELVSEKIDLKEYLTKKLQADDFTDQEIVDIFKVMAANRQAELLALVEKYLEAEPVLSRNTLTVKLKENQYAEKEVEQALESAGVDWKEQAVRASEEYINTKIELDDEPYEVISRKCLSQFLVEEKKFTLEEATYGVKESAIDWKEQAVKQAKYYLVADAYSKEGLIKKLILDGFTKEEAEYGVTQTQTDWKEQAMKKAKSYCADSLLQSKKDLLDFLQQEGFSAEEIDYVINLIFKNTEENELEVEKPSVAIPAVSVPKRPLIIKPLEFITSHAVISTQTAINKVTDSKGLSPENSKTSTNNKIQSSKKEIAKAGDTAIEEDSEELEETSLFDSPIILPVIMVLVVGNLYLFQKS